jgi:Tol biopolymer transport system component
MPYPKYACLILIFFAIGLSVRAQEATPSALPDNLAVAWVENGNLVVWTTADGTQQLVSEHVITPYLSPDGEHIAFTRGAEGFPDNIWLAALEETDSRELIAVDALPTNDDEALLTGQLSWFDSATLYFNTTRRSEYGQDRRDDLWTVHIDSGEAVMLLPPGEGGAFSFSPDHRYIAVTNPGIYDGADGFIRIINTQTATQENSLSFAAVSTGSEYRFYPEVFWEVDSSALRVAIPDKDLIYDEEGSPPVALWRLGVDGSQEQIGSADASFFGLPRWSDDAAFMTYLRRVGDQTSNRFELVVAYGHGENRMIYASGEAGSLGVPTWLPRSVQFVYPQGQPGEYWLGRPGRQPYHLPYNMVNLQLVSSSEVVGAARSANTFELHYVRLNDPTSTLITTINTPLPVFDARLMND